MYKLLTKKELNNLKIKSYKKDSILFFENDECHNVSIVLEGTILIKSYTNSGKEIVYNTINKGEMFGNNLLFSDDRHYKGDVIAQNDVKVLLINKEELLNIFKHNNQFLEEYLRITSNTSKNLNSKIKLLSFDLAQDRLMYYLKINNYDVSCDSITHLSKELNLTRETTSRLISKLVLNKTIKYKDGIISLIKRR